MSTTATFTPDWTSPPGDTVLDIANERGWTHAELARKLGYTEGQALDLIKGEMPVSADFAVRLEQVLGSTADFWLAREANFRKRQA